MNKELIELLREARRLISDGSGAQLYGEPYLSDALDRIDAALAQPAAQAVPASCTWTADTEADSWDTACGRSWVFIEGGPTDNNVRFCRGCGKPVVLAAAPEVKP
jgi:hypothetical protein